MTLDMNSLIDNAASTGTVTTASCSLEPFASGPVYDVPFSRGVPRITPLGCKSTTTAVVLPTHSFGATQDGQCPTRLSQRVSNSLKKRDKASTPACLAKNLFREASYIAIVRHAFDTAESDVREKIIWELGADLDNPSFRTRGLTTSQVHPDCNVLEFAGSQLNRPPPSSRTGAGGFAWTES